MNKKKIEKIKKEVTENSKSSFKEAVKVVFAKKNMWALTIGIIIGGSISALINSIAKDLIMTPITKALGFNEIKDLTYGTIKIGNFLEALLSFLILVITLIILVFIITFIYRSIMKKVGAKNIDEIKKIKPTTDQLILEELRNLNKNISKKNK